MTKSDHDNHSNQCNPNNDSYWQSRGHDERPDDWEEQHEADERKEEQNPADHGSTDDAQWTPKR